MRFLTIFFIIFLISNISAANSLPNASNTPFDIKNANRQFDKINLQLSTQNLNIHNLGAAVAILNELIIDADICVEDLEKKIVNTETLIKQDSSGNNDKNEGADLVYLNSQQKELNNDQAQCRLFSIRAKEAIDAYKKTMIDLKQEETLSRGLPLWSLITENIDAPPSKNPIFKQLTTDFSQKLPPLSFWIISIGVSLSLAILILLKIRKNQFVRHYLRFKELRPSNIILVSALFISFTLCAYLSFFSQNLPNNDLGLMLSKIILIYLLSLSFIVLLFKFKKTKAILYWYYLNERFFISFTITVLSLYTIAIIGKMSSNLLATNNSIWQLAQTIYILITLITGAYFIRFFCQKHRRFSFIKNHYKFIINLSMTLIITAAIINILGYHILAQRLTNSGFITFAIIFVAILSCQGIQKAYLNLNQRQASKEKIIKYFGYKDNQIFTEFLILKTIMQIIIITISIYLIGESLNFASNFIENIYDKLLNGVHIVNTTIYPMRISSGLVIFCLLYLLFRAISTAISRRRQFENEEETQVAVASILTYIGFSLALITGLIVAGFDFTSLAIIAGALSVGIGLGLQSIVNNFVSGLILLIEKPIRPGDRINIDGVEGFVKKISVRSTQIMTPENEDIIIPNGDLITRKVTNYMLSNKYFRITCEISVAFNTNTSLIKDLLLNIANDNDEVIKTGRNKPAVLFHAFANKALVFRLICLIKDVNNKAHIQSELNYAIESRLRENKIKLA